jgi:hypothetical protein
VLLPKPLELLFLPFPLPLPLPLLLGVGQGGEGPPENLAVLAEVGVVATTAAKGAHLLRA